MRLGIDIGGTKTHAVLLAADQTVADQLRLPTGFGADQVVETAVDAAERLAARHELKPRDLASVGVGVPGTVDHGSGRVTHALNLGIADLDLGAILAARLGIDVRVENDVKAAAVGAYHLLDRDVSSMAYLNLGTGLAAGLVLQGELWRGYGGFAGEIGHVPVDPDGPTCACGQRGCLETLASGGGIARQWPTDTRNPVQALYAAAAAGDPHAADVKAGFVAGVAAAVRMLVLTAGVELVVVGGGISTLGSPLEADVKAALDGWSRTSSFLGAAHLSERVTIVPDRFVAGSVGAALVGRDAWRS
jgi:predicted NBD/HSP70 family sugar kinase